MQNKQNTKAKVIVIAIAILLCLALAVGITGAFYQARRRATGTVKMDKGIVIDYTGFGKTPNEGTWLRETTISFKLFEDANVQPGEKISLLDAGIKANTTSVDFYARVKLSYEFYNGETKLETLPASFKASDLITTSATFFGSDWVDSGAGDGYYYYATGTALNKFTSSTPATFVDLFNTNAQFIIEGTDFTGSYPDGEGGGFVVDETTSINKIVVYLTLETLQGDVTAEELNTMGWKINVSSMVDFSKIESENARIETSVGKVETTENLNVSVGGAAEVPLNKVVFPYDTDTILTFDSNNVEYVNLTYTNGETETFEEVSTNSFKVNAKSSKGSVKGYTIGLFRDIEYTGFTFATKGSYEDGTEYTIENGITVIGYFGNTTNLTIPSLVRVRERDFKMTFDAYSNKEEFWNLAGGKILNIKYPCKVNNSLTLNSQNELYVLTDSINNMTDEDFMATYPTMEFKFKTLCVTTSMLYSEKNVKEINHATFAFDTNLISVSIPNSITKIGNMTFYKCENLTTLNIGSGLTSIGEMAFDWCINLNTIQVASENATFHSDGNCLINTNNKTLVLGCKNSIIPTDGSVTIIGENAFFACSNLTTITIPDCITKIENFAFQECAGLTTVNIGNGVISIGEHAFNYCTGLNSITIPSSVTSIGDGAFADCSGLTSITIGNSVTSIAAYAFHGCTGLTTITIPDSVTSIGYSVFYNCSSLTSITIPDSVTSIGSQAFDGCDNLQASTTEGGISYLGNATNKYFIAWKVADKTLSSYTIKDGCKVIYDDCFRDCSTATEITIPSSVISIGEWAFYGCSGLTSITIPSSVTSIGAWAFRNCGSLTSITIPDSVTSIGDYAFAGCSNLTTTIGDIGGTWVKVEDSSAVDASTLLRDISYDIRRNA